MNRDEIDAIETELITLCAQLDSASHRQLTLIRAYDESGVWARYGMRSCAAWLGYRVGISPGAAREKVRVARALAELPLIDAALQAGRISYSKVRALTRVATAGNEKCLLHIATCTTAHRLERVCRGLRHELELEEEDVGKQRRWVAFGPGSGGMDRVNAQLLPDEAARVQQAIDAAREDTQKDVPAGAPYPSRADGLVRMAEEYLANRNAESSKSVGGGDRTTLMVHLERHEISGGFRAMLGDGTPLHSETFRRLACDSGLVAVETDEDKSVLNVGRKTRSIPPAIRRALSVRDKGCAFPGCSHTRFLDAHHTEHWASGGETRTGNLVLLCSFHHRLVHEGGHRAQMHHGRPRFFDEDGKPIDPHPPRPTIASDGCATLIANNGAAGQAIDRRTNLIDWFGEPVDYSYVITVAYQATRRQLAREAR